jgi:hypothetical protein
MACGAGTFILLCISAPSTIVTNGLSVLDRGQGAGIGGQWKPGICDGRNFETADVAQKLIALILANFVAKTCRLDFCAHFLKPRLFIRGPAVVFDLERQCRFLA